MSPKRTAEDTRHHRGRKKICIDLTVPEPTSETPLGGLRRSLQSLQGYDEVVQNLEAENHGLRKGLECASQRADILADKTKTLGEVEGRLRATNARLEETKRKHKQKRERAEKRVKDVIGNLRGELRRAKEQIAGLELEKSCALGDQSGTDQKNHTRTNFEHGMDNVVIVYVKSSTSSLDLVQSVRGEEKCMAGNEARIWS